MTDWPAKAREKRPGEEVEKVCKVLDKVCERGTICQQKVYERGSFFVKNDI